MQLIGACARLLSDMSDESRRRTTPRLIPATVGGRLAAVLVPAVVILLFAAVAVGWAAQRQHSQAHEIALHYESASLSQQIATNWLYADATTGRYFTQPTNDVRLAVQEKEDLVSQDLQRFREIETTTGTPADMARIDSAIAQTAAMVRGRASVMNTIDQGDAQTAGTILAQLTQDSGPGLAQLQAIAATERQEVLDLTAQSSRTADTTAFAIGGVVFAIVLLGLIAAVAISRSVVRPLAHLRETARAIGGVTSPPGPKTAGPERSESSRTFSIQLSPASSSATPSSAPRKPTGAHSSRTPRTWSSQSM